MSDNKFPADFRVEANNGSTFACVRHAIAIARIAGMLGGTYKQETLADDEVHECANCINEAKAEAAGGKHA